MPFDHEPKVRILIVEDEVIIADDLEGRLGQLGYFVCGKAVTSEEALELAARRKPDLVVMDIVLKGNTDGIDAAGFIRDTLGIPIVYMTSYADTGHLEKAKPTYPFGYLLKPFQDRDLKITLEMALYAARLDAERSRAEKALHDSRRFLNSTGRMAKVGGWEFDPQSETIKWTEETHRIYGVALDHVPSLAESMDAFHPDEREKIAGAFIRALESGEPYDLEVRFINARGEHLWTRTICRPETVDGRVVMLRGTFQDVTGRKRTEEALRQSEEKYRLATEATTDGLWDWNIITGDVYYSPAWNRMLGLDQDEQNYQAWESRIHPDERSALLEGLQAHLDGQTEQWSREHRLQTAGGNWKWVLGRGRVVERDADGRPGRMVGTMTDISERKQAEMALATRNRELEALHRISGIALSDQPLSAMLEVIAREVAAAVGFPIVSIEYYDETRQEMEFAASTVIPGPVKDMALRVPVTQTLSGVVIRTGRPLVETRAMDRPEYASEALRSLKVRTFVCLPMLAGSRVIGALSLASPSAVLLDEHILPLSASLANLIAGIIHRKRAEDALLESESTYRLLFDGSNDALFIHGLNEDGLPGRFWDVNQVACKRLGYTREELLSLSPLDIGAHGLEETVRTRGRQLLENGRAVFETVHVAKDGRRIPVESSASVFEYKGRPAILSIARYISDRKRAEEAVQESEKRLRLTFNTHPDAISINRMEDGRYLEVNEGFCRLSGYTPEETVGKSSLEINIWHDPADRERLISILREKGSCDNLEFQFRMKDGSLTAGLMSARIISLRGVPCSLSITRNISEQKRAEAERENLQKQLLQAQKMESVGTLAGGIAHDFNNLLQAMNGYTQLLLMDRPKGNSDYPHLKEIERACTRATQLVRQLLLFSRKVEADRRPIDLNEEVEQARKLLERTIPKMVHIEVRSGSGLWAVLADPVQIEQALLNLGSNAADAMPDGGRLILETRNITLDEEFSQTHLGANPGNYVLLTVSDTGCGMDTQTLEHIFDPFFTTKEFGKGTGLGLASVYGIVKGHGGYIMSYSEPGQGATFKIYLPAIERDGPDALGRDSEHPLIGGSETILLVDDEAPIRGFAGQVLAQFGYQVMTASNGREALQIYAEHRDRIDLVILDIGMPVMGGHQCLRELRQADPLVKVLMTSGYSINGHAKQAMESGAMGFISKPYQLNDFLGRVRAALDAKI